jgi:hypothetical protein
MDEELRLWAISVDLVRQCFSPPPTLAGTLREVTLKLAPPVPPPTKTGLLSKLGPLMRTPLDAPRIPVNQPTVVDGESLMTSRYIASERRAACWTITQAWLDELACGHTVIPLPASQLNDLEFDLVRAEVPTQLSIRHLWYENLDIPLHETDDMSIGFMPHDRVLRLQQEWTRALSQFDETTTPMATALLEFIDSHFGDPAIEAQDQGLDLIAWWTSR